MYALAFSCLFPGCYLVNAWRQLRWSRREKRERPSFFKWPRKICTIRSSNPSTLFYFPADRLHKCSLRRKVTSSSKGYPRCEERLRFLTSSPLFNPESFIIHRDQIFSAFRTSYAAAEDNIRKTWVLLLDEQRKLQVGFEFSVITCPCPCPGPLLAFRILWNVYSHDCQALAQEKYDKMMEVESGRSEGHAQALSRIQKSCDGMSSKVIAHSGPLNWFSFPLRISKAH